jgi:hypothetical protein
MAIWQLFKAQITLLHVAPGTHVPTSIVLIETEKNVLVSELKCEGRIPLVLFSFLCALLLLGRASYSHHRGNSTRLSFRYTVLSGTLAFPLFYICLRAYKPQRIKSAKWNEMTCQG